jgi:hypothetical protein
VRAPPIGQVGRDQLGWVGGGMDRPKLTDESRGLGWTLELPEVGRVGHDRHRPVGEELAGGFGLHRSPALVVVPVMNSVGALARRRNRDSSGRRSEMDTTALLARSACTRQSRTILTAAGSSARVRGESVLVTTPFWMQRTGPSNR